MVPQCWRAFDFRTEHQIDLSAGQSFIRERVHQFGPADAAGASLNDRHNLIASGANSPYQTDPSVAVLATHMRPVD